MSKKPLLRSRQDLKEKLNSIEHCGLEEQGYRRALLCVQLNIFCGGNQ